MTRALIAIFAIATGQAVASNYLAQPLLEEIRRDLHLTTAVAGLIVTTAQIGYAAGLVLLLPLGDLLERRRLITGLAAVTALGLAAAGFAPSIGVFLGAAGLIGFTSVMAQLLVPFAAGLSPDAERGSVVGLVMSGLLIGILLARTASGFIAELGGWRTVYWVAAGLMLAQTFVLRSKLPTYREHVTLRYPRLLGSVLAIARAEPVLRRRAVYGALSFACFSVLWTTLAFLLSRTALRVRPGDHRTVRAHRRRRSHAGDPDGPVLRQGLDARRHRRGGAAPRAGLRRHVARHLRRSPRCIVGIVVLDVGAQAVHITEPGRDLPAAARGAQPRQLFLHDVVLRRRRRRLCDGGVRLRRPWLARRLPARAPGTASLRSSGGRWRWLPGGAGRRAARRATGPLTAREAKLGTIRRSEPPVRDLPAPSSSATRSRGRASPGTGAGPSERPPSPRSRAAPSSP